MKKSQIIVNTHWQQFKFSKIKSKEKQEFYNKASNYRPSGSIRHIKFAYGSV